VLEGNLQHRLRVLRRGIAGGHYSRAVLAWMDLEMTGLDPTTDVIVEIATLLTDDDLEIIAEGPDLVIAATAEQLAQMNSYVTEMHTRSGLLEAIQASSISLADAGAQTLAFLTEHLPGAGVVPLCGNSIGTDRKFLARYLPAIEAQFHYRSVDVSSIKELARRWYPEALDAQPAKATTHRALDDIKESVAELAYYRRTVFAERSTTMTEPHV
jgi:oligoribonuclease